MRSLGKYRNKDGKIFLNIASSTRAVEGFVNLDNDIFLHLGGLFARFRRILPKKYLEVHSDDNQLTQALDGRGR